MIGIGTNELVTLIPVGFLVFLSFKLRPYIINREKTNYINQLGFRICSIGTIVSVLFVPCEFYGTNAGYHFVGSQLNGFGQNYAAFQLINMQTLLLQIIAVNAFGALLIWVGNTKVPSSTK